MMITYAIFDNGRVTADRVSVTVPGLPKEFDGYTILLITDLHGKQFGENQSGVMSALGGSDFDLVLFGGDMIHDRTGDSEAFYNLVEALAPFGKPMYYVPGNHDPANYTVQNGHTVAHPFAQGVIDRGAQLLETPIPLKKNTSAQLWLWPTEQLYTDVEAAIETIGENVTLLETADSSNSPEIRAELEHLSIMLAQCDAIREAREAVGEEDIHLALSHFPMTPARIETTRESEMETGPSLLDASLLMAGHYHAGQWRVLGYGAVWVPAPLLPRKGWFPDQELVSGLHQVDSLTQYVSGGLGSTGPALVRFRLLNTPSVALIRLTSRSTG